MPSLDPGVERGIQLQLQKDPPFTDDDLAAVETLTIPLAREIRDVARLTNLRVLVLGGYGGRDLAPLAGLPRLAAIVMQFTTVADLDVVSTLPTLRRLRLPNNAITDVAVLAEGLPKLREVNLTGNPLSDASYHEVVPALRERVPEVEVSAEREWRITRRLHEAGMPFDYYRDGERYLLCRPGYTYTPTPDAGHLTIEPDQLEAVLDRDPAEVLGLFASQDS